MYVRGKYGKSLRLDVLKKNTPAANDNLNTIGNSRSTPKEKGIKKEEGLLKAKHDRKPSHDGFPLFPFEPPGMNPFGNGLLPFPPLGEPMGLFGLSNAEFRIKDLMQSMQNLQSQTVAETGKMRGDLMLGNSEVKENLDNSNKSGDPKDNIPAGLASLLMKAKEFQDKKDEEPKTGLSKGEDMETDKDDEIPQIAIKPLEVSGTTLVSTAPLEMKIPAPPASEISAQ